MTFGPITAMGLDVVWGPAYSFPKEVAGRLGRDG